MLLNNLDWGILVAFFLLSLFIGIWSARSNKNSSEFFTGGGNMPWWLLAVSMVATTFSTDTPNLVTDIVRQNGISGNWVWWTFLLTGMLTVFVYARLWKKSGIVTDIEFYEMRYSGGEAAFLRGFRAVYLGFFFNIMIMASVSLAAIKISGILLGFSPTETILVAGSITVVYSMLGGFKGVLITDFVQFFIAIAGSIAAAYYSLQHPAVGGMENLLNHELVKDKLDFFPSMSNWEQFVPILLIPVLIQWWSVWYPGAEPGGGGYIAQRMFAAKNEDGAIKSVLFFNAMHYALRPWPWIIVALCSIVVFPDLESIKAAFPNAAAIARDDLGYSAMLTFLPHGLLGLVVTSLIAAYMSTISTHLNWGSSYIVLDFYKRFLKPDSSENELVWVGRISTFILMALTMLLTLQLENALQTFNILLQIGAGTGLLFIMRWFWWRINASSEIAAMISSFLIAIYFNIIHVKLGFEAMESHWQLIYGVFITTIVWVVTALVTKPTEKTKLYSFLKKTKPGGPGWKKVVDMAKADGIALEEIQDPYWKVPAGILSMVFGAVAIYSFLFGSGHILFHNYGKGVLFLCFTVAGIIGLRKTYPKILG